MPGTRFQQKFPATTFVPRKNDAKKLSRQSKLSREDILSIKTELCIVVLALPNQSIINKHNDYNQLSLPIVIYLNINKIGNDI